MKHMARPSPRPARALACAWGFRATVARNALRTPYPQSRAIQRIDYSEPTSHHLSTKSPALLDGRNSVAYPHSLPSHALAVFPNGT
jgi:hypothetical protein